MDHMQELAASIPKEYTIGVGPDQNNNMAWMVIRRADTRVISVGKTPDEAVERFKIAYLAERN